MVSSGDSGDGRLATATRRAVLGAGAAATAALATACAAGQSGQPAGGPMPALAGTVQHVYWGGTVEATLQYAMDTFAKRAPAAKIELVPIPNAQVQEKLILLVAAGTAPDTAQVNPRQLTPLIDKGILADVTKYAKRDAKEFDQDDFYPAALERLIKNGKLFGAPNQMGNLTFMYNADLLRAAGESLPQESWTWDTVAQVAQRVTKGEGDSKKFGCWVPPWEILVWAYGAEILDKTERVCLLTDPKAQAGLQWLQDLRFKQQAAPKPDEVPGITVDQLFQAGRLAMRHTDPGGVTTTAKGNPAFQWDVVVMPKGPARRATIVQGPSSACIAQSKHLDLAWEWLKWWTGVEVRKFASREEMAVGARKSTAAEFLKQPPPPANRKALIDSAAFAKNQPYIPQYDEMTKIVNAEWDAALVQNTKSVRDATESAKRQIDALLAGGK